MKSNRWQIMALLCVFFLTLAATATAFAGANEIKARMKSRLPEINALKNDGIIGENNKGFLEYVGSKKIKADLVNAENHDRRIVYKAIAKKQKADHKLVGERRANQIRNKAPKGSWVQLADGKWEKK